MTNPTRNAAPARPVAILIAAKMRAPKPSNAPPRGHAVTRVTQALKHAAQSSPSAKSAFRRAAPAVKTAQPHLEALAKRPGNGLLSKAWHGVAAVRSLRKVTRELRKEGTKGAATNTHSLPAASFLVMRPGPRSAKGNANAPPSAAPGVLAATSTPANARAALRAAKASSPAAKQAFHRNKPEVARATTHLDALLERQRQPGASLLSKAVHGVQALHTLRKVTKALVAQDKTRASLDNKASDE